MRRVHLIGVLGAVLVFVLAGCVAGPSGPPVSTASVPQDAPQEGGDGSYDLTLRIVDEPGGPGIPNAAIIVYWGEYDGEGSGSFEISGSADSSPGSSRADGVVRLEGSASTPKPETTVPLRTGSDGTATAHVPANQVVGIVASAAGHTEEWVPRAVTGGSGSGGTVAFPVYKAQITETINGSLSPAGGSAGKAPAAEYDWYPQEVPWGETDAARQGYVDRLANLRMTLTWTNGPTGGGDLAIAGGTTTSEISYVYDSDNPDAAPGEQTEEALLDTEGINELGWPNSDTLYLGPATGAAFVAPLGMDYQLTLEAQFNPFASPTGSSASSENSAPMPVVAIVPALAVAALVLRRDPRSR